MKKTKITIALLITILVISVMPTSVFALSGAGTVAEPYIISSVADLEYVKTNLSAHYKMGANIPLSSAWTPIGTNEFPFKGSFDGDGHTVSGLTVTVSGETVFAGLFGYSTGDIKNVKVNMAEEGINVTATKSVYAGAIVGYTKDGEVSNCFASGKITVNIASSSNMADVFAGMIAGRSNGPLSANVVTGEIDVFVAETEATGTVANPAQIYAGGIVGLAQDDLSDNEAAVAVNADSSALSEYVGAEVYAGGIAGKITGDIVANKASGHINGKAVSAKLEAAVYAGGLAGYVEGNVETAYATGNVSAETVATSARTYAGGLVGYLSGNVEKTYSIGDVSSISTNTRTPIYAGGLVGLANGKVSTSYALGKATVEVDGAIGFAGGLLGFASKPAENAYYKSSSGYTTFTGCGNSKTEAELKTQATFTGYDFAKTWGISEQENGGYPYLVELTSVYGRFEDAEFTYDGTAKTITATDIADGVTVSYSNNTATEAGVYTAVATLVTDGYKTAIITARLTINPKRLTVKGLKINDKEFDNTTDATLDVSEVVLEGILPGDEVSVDAENCVANFVSDNIGDNRQVIISELGLKGKDAANYTCGVIYGEANILEGTFDHVKFEGSGTAQDPYIIYDEDELNAVRGKPEAHFKLANNITLTETWVPIGRINKPFRGTFDGDNYTISGISVDPTINYAYSGLFGYNEGTITKTNVLINDNVSTIATNVHIGAVAGYNGGTISNCIVNGTIATDPVSTYAFVGGIAGYNTGEISDCDVNIEIIAKGSTVYAGGVAGYNESTIKRTSSTGDVTVNNALFAYAGGFVGINTMDIINCYSTGDVLINVPDITFMADAGGFAGRVEGGKINYCYSTGSSVIEETSGSAILNKTVGGFAAFDEGTLSNCFYDTNTSGLSDTGKGTPKTTAELKASATFNGWDLDLWSFDERENDGYPYLEKSAQIKEKALLGYSDKTVTVSAYTRITSATLIVASYSEGALIDIRFNEDFTIDKGETLTYTVDSDFEEVVGGQVKVMLWKDFSSVIPLCTYKQVDIR